MNKLLLAVFLTIFAVNTNAQDLTVKAKGVQTFNFEDQGGRNQTTFFSRTVLEDITGLTNDVKGKVTFEIGKITQTLKGKISISASSLKSGIALRDEHLVGENWLNAGKFPEITFEIKKVNKILKSEGNKVTVNVTGDFTLKGVTKSVTSDFSLTYLDENDKTKTRAPGDLLGVRGKFEIKLSDYGVTSPAIPGKVSNEIEIEVNIVGSNK